MKNLYSTSIGDLLTEDRLNPLGSGQPNEKARPALQALTIDGAFVPQKVNDRDMASCCLAGLWLYHDFLDQAHQIAQDLDTVEGSFWHGILHRREGDFWNSKYWFRRVGRHPVFEPLRRAVGELTRQEQVPDAVHFLLSQKSWDPFAFVDLCEATSSFPSGGKEFPLVPLCQRIQKCEWELLFEYCYRHAVDND